MNCLSCGCAVLARAGLLGSVEWLTCVTCGLCGPRDVLEALAARLAPAGVLDEADKIMWTHGSVIDIEYQSGDRVVNCDTYAHAYETLVKETP